MKKLVLFTAICVCFLWGGVAGAQTVVAVDIAKANLSVEHAQGSGGVPAEFRVKCEKGVDGTWTTIPPYSITAPAFAAQPGMIRVGSAPLLSVLGSSGVGDYRCAASAANEFGESPASAPPFLFRAGATPAAPSTIQLNTSSTPVTVK